MRRRILIAFLLDTWVWIDYWNEAGSRAKEYIESDNDLVISMITLDEVSQRFAPQGKTMVDARVNEMLNYCTLIPISREIATLAGMLRHNEIQGGIADAIILATAKLGKHTIVTGDLHFKNLPDVVFLGSG
ncbi:PIN domain-containing protein [Methanoregula sp.]|jgi:predicted nucleic acid-binding protein|uniref:PIN domain-containing protein n=1 Tax=Methanoregula sp. TaxID=2052170 RepID=UPI003561A7CC